MKVRRRDAASFLGIVIALGVSWVIFYSFMSDASWFSTRNDRITHCPPVVTLEEILDYLVELDDTEVKGIEILKFETWLKEEEADIVFHVDNGTEKFTCHMSDGTNEKGEKVRIGTEERDDIDPATVQYIINAEDEYTMNTVVVDGVLSEIYFKIKQ